MKLRGLLGLVGATFGMTMGVCMGQETPPAPPATPRTEWPNVVGSSTQTFTTQKQLQLMAYTRLQELKEHPTPDAHRLDGSFDRIFSSIGELHIPMGWALAEMLDFELDPSLPSIGRCFPLGIDFYPAAKAFAEVADKRDIERLFESLKKPQSEKMLQICAYILVEVHGVKLARLEVQNEIDEETARLDEDKSGDSAYKTNLQHIKALLPIKKHPTEYYNIVKMPPNYGVFPRPVNK